MLEAVDIGHAFQNGTPFCRRVLAGVSLKVEAGETVLLTGRSGSGKTTLARIMAGLERPGHGVVRHGGQALRGGGDAGISPAARVVLACQYPERQFFAGTVREELSWGLRVGLGMGEAEIARRLVSTCEQLEFPLAELGDRPPRSLSSGQQRKAAMASLLVLEPRVLILDEPFAGLSLGERRLLVEVLRRWPDGRRSMLVVTHELELLLGWVSRVVVLDSGRVVFSGSSTELCSCTERAVEAAVALPPLLELGRWLKRQGLIQGPVRDDLALLCRQVKEAFTVRMEGEGEKNPPTATGKRVLPGAGSGVKQMPISPRDR
jgi:energy-coupling factor transporter ATP-binding protein EcfA2